MVAPLFVLLYGAFHPAPFLVNAAILGALVVYAFSNRVLTNAGTEATTEDEAALSSLERDREGVSV